MKFSPVLLLLLFVVAFYGSIFGFIILTGGYAAGDPVYSDLSPAGFLAGLWHGLILGISFIISLFNPEVGIYEAHNNGAWYNLGFMIGLNCSVSGGVSRLSKAHTSGDKDEEKSL